MTSRLPKFGISLLLSAVALGAGWATLRASTSTIYAASSSASDPEQLRASLEQAQRAASQAARRAQQLESEANSANEAAEKTTREAAALAARIQQAEADILAAQARYALISDQRRVLDARLAERQQPLVQLTGALQNMARRPIVLSALQPGSLKDTVYVRAVLETTLPEIHQRTASLRGELERGRELERDARQAIASLQAGETELQERRDELTALAASQRLASREARLLAQRENQRALERGENARDLDEWVAELGRAGSLREELAALSGPILRPPRPGASRVMQSTLAQPSPRSTGAPSALQLPVQGTPILGFGEEDQAGLPSSGLQLLPGPGAQVVAPAEGRVAFAGPYRGFGRIVIIDHGGGWTSLITGLARSDVDTGSRVIGGSPIGTAPTSNPAITLELRRDGTPVNPLDHM